MSTPQEPLNTASATQMHAARELVAQRPEPPQPWWREPWPWILMAGPFIAMVACIITMMLATQGFDAQAIRDGGRKQGLVVSKPTALAKHATSARNATPAPERSDAAHAGRRTP